MLLPFVLQRVAGYWRRNAVFQWVLYKVKCDIRKASCSGLRKQVSTTFERALRARSVSRASQLPNSDVVPGNSLLSVMRVTLVLVAMRARSESTGAKQTCTTFKSWQVCQRSLAELYLLTKTCRWVAARHMVGTVKMSAPCDRPH